MNKLSKYLLIGLLEQESKIIALYGGGFKPPTKGHFEVVQKTLKDHPEIDKLYVVIGSGLRNNISQDESSSIWEIYKKHLPPNVEIIKTQSPLSYIKNFLKENPENTIYAVVGTRDGDENDAKDFTQRKEFFEKYSDKVKVLNIITPGGTSGTAARKAATTSKEEFLKFIPGVLTKDEQDIIYGYVESALQENTPPKVEPQKHDFPKLIKSLTEYMINQGMELKPLPKIRFIKDDSENASNFFGKTAYYDPNQRLIILYTMNRHPKDIMRSFAHEMIHHMQNCENRLMDISTDNTNEDGALPEIEREAYEKGNMIFRNWEDNIKNTPQQLTEGKYDKISNLISSNTFNKWKEDFVNNKTESTYQEHIKSSLLDFNVVGVIKFIDEGESLKVDGGVEETEDGEILYIDFEIDKNTLPEMWSEISMNLKDVVRHEIEHLTQSDLDNYPSKYMKDDQFIRDIIQSKLLPPSFYFKLEKEIDANLQGMYFRAKKEKIPFIDVINNYLSYQDITPQQKEEIIDLWRSRSKELNLPSF